MKIIEDYLDILDDEILFESDDSGLRSIISKLRKVKVSSSDKKEADKQLKQIESTNRFKNVKSAIVAYSKNPTRESSRKLNQDLKKELNNFALSQIGTAIGVIIIGSFMAASKLKNKKIGPDLISSLICILAELPPILITRLFSKSGKKLVDIKNDIESNNVVSKFSMIETLIGFLLLIPFLIPAAGAIIPAATVGLVVLSLSKMVVGLYVGIKTNRYDIKEMFGF